MESDQIDSTTWEAIMKKALHTAISLIGILLTLGFRTTVECQTIERMFTELTFDTSGWKLEMHPQRVRLLNGWSLQTTTSRAYFRSGISLDTGYVVATSEWLLTPLSVNPLGDTLSISDGQLTRQILTFGSVAGAVIAAPRFGQSLSSAPGVSKYYWYLDNTPTLGCVNDFINAMGILTGTACDSSGSPIPGTRVYYGDSPQPFVQSDSAGLFAISDCARVEKLLFVHPAYPALSQLLQLWPESTVTMSFKLQDNSLVDVFPLAIGNQWSYGYNYDWADDPLRNPMWSWRDTGSVTLRIFGKVVATDSTRWLIQQAGIHWTSFNEGPWSGPNAQTDTFELFEFTAGNHWMYRTGNVAEVRKSIFPFLRNLADTGKVFRYAQVDSAGTRRFRTEEVPRGVFFTFQFTRGVGLTSVFMFNGITGWPHYSTRHSLRSYTVSDVKEPPRASLSLPYSLHQNYPNPFNPATTISFSLQTNHRVRLSVVDLLGREVKLMLDEEQSAGNHALTFDARQTNGGQAGGLASGVYFYKLQAGSFASVKKMVITR